MIKKSFCAFFSNFKYFFSACGVIYLALIVIIASLLGFGFQLIANLSAEAVAEIRVIADGAVAALGTPQSFSAEFYTKFAGDVAGVIIENIDNFAAIFISVCCSYIVILSLAFTYATRLCRNSIRNDAIRLGFLKTLGANAARVIIAMLFFALYFFIANTWKLGIIPLCIVAALIIICENLFSTWLIYFRHQPLKKFLNVKNTVALVAAYLVILALMCAIISLCAIYLGQFVSLVITLPLLAYTLAVMDGVSVAYFEENEQNRTIKTYDQ